MLRRTVGSAKWERARRNRGGTGTSREIPRRSGAAATDVVELATVLKLWTGASGRSREEMLVLLLLLLDVEGGVV